MDLYGDLPPPGSNNNSNSNPLNVDNDPLLSVFLNAPKSNNKDQQKKPLEAKKASISKSSVEASVIAPVSFAFKPRQTAITREQPKKQSVSHFTTSAMLTPSTSSTAANIGLSSKDLMAPLPMSRVELGTFDVDDVYDPFRPNDYLQYCDERAELKRQKRIERDNKRILSEREQDRVRVERERVEAMQRGDLLQVEASLGGRGRGRGLSNLPSWMTDSAITSNQPPPITAQSNRIIADDTDSAPSKIMFAMGSRERQVPRKFN
jgi:hypothetical protein